VFGQAQQNTNLRWVIFDSLQSSDPVWISPSQLVSGRPGSFATRAIWYDSPAINFTLMSGHTYAIGVFYDR
jgi:hypothetical protein